MTADARSAAYSKRGATEREVVLIVVTFAKAARVTKAQLGTATTGAATGTAVMSITDRRTVAEHVVTEPFETAITASVTWRAMRGRDAMEVRDAESGFVVAATSSAPCKQRVQPGIPESLVSER